MINRKYFIHGRKSHNDGAGSYGWRQCIFTHQTWLSDPENAYEQAYQLLEKQLTSVTSDSPIEVIAFNRI